MGYRDRLAATNFTMLKERWRLEDMSKTFKFLNGFDDNDTRPLK